MGRLSVLRSCVAGFAFIVAAALPAGPGAIADTRNPGEWGSGRSAVLDLLGNDRSAFAAFAETDSFRRVAGLPTERVSLEVPADQARVGTRTAVAALERIDADTAAAMSNARSQAVTDMLTTDLGGLLSLGEIDRVKVGIRSPEWRCLTEALYFEARGESLIGQFAVAEVILNRVDSEAYPDSICDVVRQGEGKRNACQFSFFCDGKAEDIANRRAFEKLGKVSWVMLQGKPRVLTGKATHYHNSSVNPRWATRMVRTARIGDHIFYRKQVQLSQR